MDYLLYFLNKIFLGYTHRYKKESLYVYTYHVAAFGESMIKYLPGWTISFVPVFPNI